MARIYLGNYRNKRSPGVDTSSGNVINPNPHLKSGINSKSKSLKDKSIINDTVNYTSKVSYSNLFSSIIIILVAVALIRVLYYGTSDGVTLGSLLDILRDTPQVSTSVKNFVQQLQIPGPWAILDELRNFINLNLQIVSIVVWLASSLIDVCFFISHFLMWLFI